VYKVVDLITVPLLVIILLLQGVCIPSCGLNYSSTFTSDFTFAGCMYITLWTTFFIF
jgi:hypothetical protein